jgi:putative glutamine amidotransferase
VLIGGDDPIMEDFGEPTHPEATPVRPARQEYELALLRSVDPLAPVLGVCFGMQLMALVAGGTLDQHMPETMADAFRHWEAEHPVQSLDSTIIESGRIYSRHRQRVLAPGAMTVIAKSDDDVIEAIADPARPSYVGVQWHPERTEAHALGQGLFDRLVKAARTRTKHEGRHFEAARSP